MLGKVDRELVALVSALELQVIAPIRLPMGVVEPSQTVSRL